MLRIKNLTVKIGKKKILHRIDFNFKKGKIYAIMGPNGSGKSTLAATIMGHPAYRISDKSKIIYQGDQVSDISADKRAKKGIFLSHQVPVSLTGVSIYQLLHYSLGEVIDPVEIRRRVKKTAAELDIDEKLLSRSLNEDFSGGEKKKMEILQAAMINPKLYIFDEVDTGVDIDALKTIARLIKKIKDKNKDKTFILITHYNRILKYLKPDQVLVMIGGRIVKTGDDKLADQVEKEGYESVKSD